MNAFDGNQNVLRLETIRILQVISSIHLSRKRIFLSQELQAELTKTDPNFTNAAGVELFSFIDIATKNNDVQTELPGEYLLSQNYPNPFNPSTSINFSTPKFSDIRIKIYNVSGELVKNLLSKNSKAGSYTVYWDGLNLVGNPVPSGVYFFRMETPEFSQTKKMILIR